MDGRVATSTFVGRERELEEIAAGLDEAISGRGGLFLVSGEPGVGKTRLFTEAAALAAQRRVVTHWGRQREDRGAPAFAPWLDVLRACAEDQREELAGREGALGGALLDALGVRAPAVRDEQARVRLFESIASVLEERSAAQALVLVLEDLHAADVPSLLLLLFFAERLASQRILVLGSYRPVEAAQDQERSRLIARIARLGRPVALGGLGESDVRRLVDEFGRGGTPVALAKRIHDLTGGNPLFVDGVLRWHRAEGRPLAPETLGDAGLPHEVRDAIRRRVEVLSPRCRRTLSVASVIGREFEVPLLADGMEQSRHELLDVLHEATMAALVQAVPGSLVLRSFTHELVRATLYQDLPASERASLHRRMGETLERVGNVEARLPELAYHFVEGVLVGSPTPAVVYSRRAGAAALQSLAYEDAAEHFERALQAMALEVEPDRVAECALQVALGEARFLAGDVEAARAAALLAAARAEGLASPEPLAGAAILYRGTFRSNATDAAPVDLLRKALRAFDTPSHELRVQVLAELASALVAVPGSEEERCALAGEALELARAHGDRGRLAHVLFATHWATWGPQDLGGRTERLIELVGLAEEAGSRRLSQVHGWLHTHRLEAGDPEQTESAWTQWVREAERSRDPYARWQIAAGRAMRSLLQGRLADGEALAEEALRVGSEGNVAPAMVVFGIQQLQVKRERGELETVLEPMAAVAEQFPDLLVWRCALAAAMAETGRAAEARVVLDRLAATDFRSFRLGFQSLASLWHLAEAALALEDSTASARLYELLLPHADQCAVMHLAAWHGSISRSLGRLAALAGRLDDAVGHFEHALMVDRRMGAAVAVAHGEADTARVLDLRRGSGDPERARDLRARAQATAEALGLRMLLERLGGAEAAKAGRPAPSGTPARGDSWLLEEGDYWTIAYEGQVVRIKNSAGMEDLGVLLRHPGVELHAVQLASGVPLDPDRPDLGGAEALAGDAGALLDDEATAAYRARLEELRDAVEEAERFHDPERAARARAEIEAIADQLSAAVGLGGRKRRASSTVERARITVTKRIKRAIDRITALHPSLGRHLSRCIKTGVFCSYAPDADESVRWTAGAPSRSER